MGAGKTAVVVVVALAVGGAAGWMLAAPAADVVVATADKAAAATKERDDAREGVASLRAEVTKAHDEVGRLAKQNRDLEAELRVTKAALAKVDAQLTQLGNGAAGGSAATQKPAPTARIPSPAFDEVLGKIDWASVSEHFGAMPPALAQLLTALAEGRKPEDLPPETTESLTKHNGPLITVAVKLMQAKVPGTGANGAFTHPAFMANALVAALDGLGMPVSDGQLARLKEISARFVAEDDGRLRRYDDSTFQIRKIEEEADLRDRFFVEARSVLTQAQFDAVSPPAVRDRLQFDIFSAGVLLYTVNRPMKYETATQFAGAVAKSLGGALRLTDEQKSKFTVITAEWAAALPKEITTPSEDALDKLGILHARASLMSAVETRKLLERTANDLQLAGDSLTAARKWGVIFMPLPTPGADDGN